MRFYRLPRFQKYLGLTLFTALNGALAFTSPGLASSVTYLLSGEVRNINGTMVACNVAEPHPGPRPHPDPGPGPGQNENIPGASVYYRGDQLTFSKGADGNLNVTYSSTGESFLLPGGKIASDPIAFIDSNNEPRILAAGTDNQLYSRTLSNSTWQYWGGQILDPPIVILFRGDTYVISRGTDKVVYYHTLNSSWIALGTGQLSSPVSAWVERNDIVLQGTGMDGQIYERTLSQDWHLSTRPQRLPR